MKTLKRLILLFIAALAFITVGAIAAHADTNLVANVTDPSTLGAGIPDATTIMAVLKSILPAAVYAVLINVILVLGSFRFVVKPAISGIHWLADSTDTPKDNELINKIESSTWLKWVFFILDWAFSYKVRK